MLSAEFAPKKPSEVVEDLVVAGMSGVQRMFALAFLLIGLRGLVSASAQQPLEPLTKFRTIRGRVSIMIASCFRLEARPIGRPQMAGSARQHMCMSHRLSRSVSSLDSIGCVF